MGQISFALASLMGVRLLTEVLSPAAYGEYALALTLVALVYQCGFGPLSSGLGRLYAPNAIQSSLPLLARAWMAVAIPLSLLAVVVGLATALVANVAGGQKLVGLMCLAPFVAVVTGVDSNAEAFGTAARRRRLVAIHQTMRGLRFGGAGLLGYVYGGSSLAAFIGFLAGASVVAVSHVASSVRGFHRRATPPSPESVRVVRRELLAYAWPFAIWGLFTWMQFASDRWALQILATTTDVGRYNAIFQIGYYPVLLGSAVLHSFVQPIVYERFEKNPSSALRSITASVAATIGVAALATGSMFVLHPLVGRLLLGTEYREAAFLLPYVVLGAGLFAIGQALAMAPLATGRSSRLLGPTIVTASIGVILTFALCAGWGIRGVIAANGIYGALHVCAMGYLWWKAHQTVGLRVNRTREVGR